jgi:4-hydroxy-tetrahydrodipicolinate synthase
MNTKIETPKALKAGVITAIATPFTADSSNIDYESLDKLIKQQIEGGVTGIVIAGSTGEAATLSDVEYGALIRYIVDRVEGRILCIAGVNSSSTAKAIELASRAVDSGADKLLVVTPPYNKPTQAGIIKHFESIKTATSKSIMAYNVPGRAAAEISADSIHQLFLSEIIDSIKESSGSVDKAMDMMSKCPELPLYSGDDSLTVSLIALGAKGVVSVASNVNPVAVSRMCDLAFRGDFIAARQQLFALLPLFRAIFLESNPIPVKAALKIAGIIENQSLRLPLMSASESTVECLRRTLQGSLN